MNVSADMQCEQLFQDSPISDAHYRRIAELIFDTDPYIYPALFGDGHRGRECARQLLPSVLETQNDPMFSKENLWIATLHGAVAGMILWRRGSLAWDPETLLSCAEEKKIELNRENVLAVQKEYVLERYAYEEAPPAQILSLINVCVDKDLRNRGIGRFMLECFIREHTREDMELTVLADNQPAITLYRKVGFEVQSRVRGFSLSREKPECYIMKREAQE